MNSFETTGGARIGKANATWPFAKLKADKNKLELNASIIGNLVFRPQDIISITPYSSFISSGLKINHRVPNYQAEVIFWCIGDPTFLINQIHQTGFFENTDITSAESDMEIVQKQKSGGNPIKKPVIIIFTVLWNVLLLSDFILYFLGKRTMPIGIGTITALGTILSVSILLLVSAGFRKLLLKEGRTVKDINRFLYLIITISVFMLTVFLFLTTVIKT